MLKVDMDAANRCSFTMRNQNCMIGLARKFKKSIARCIDTVVKFRLLKKSIDHKCLIDYLSHSRAVTLDNWCNCTCLHFVTKWALMRGRGKSVMMRTEEAVVGGDVACRTVGAAVLLAVVDNVEHHALGHHHVHDAAFNAHHGVSIAVGLLHLQVSDASTRGYRDIGMRPVLDVVDGRAAAADDVAHQVSRNGEHRGHVHALALAASQGPPDAAGKS
jgi:hypothetical protein